MTERKTYHATAQREGEWWAIFIRDLPPQCAGATQSAIKDGWQKAEAMTREAISLLLDVPEDSFDVELKKETEGDI